MNKFLANSLFGMDAAALVLTNKPSLARKAKYQLRHFVRAHVGQDDRCVLRFAFCVLVWSYAAVQAMTHGDDCSRTLNFSCACWSSGDTVLHSVCMPKVSVRFCCTAQGIPLHGDL
jgi:hypothetical protein